MSDLHADAVSWLERYAAALGLQSPQIDEIETLLNLAGVAAHASHRQAAPVACWLSAIAGKSPEAALEIARSLDG
jgi:Domain of unknown function (DUF6457)